MTFSEFANKKVLGVPVLYLAGAAVVILAIVAYRMDSKESPSEEQTPEGPPDAGSEGSTDDFYDALATQGTVTVVQGANQTSPDPVVKTNETWIREGAEWLVAQNMATGSQALQALTKYINGVDRSYQEQQWVDAVFKEKGAPPDGVSEGGNVGSKPAVKQAGTLPGIHTITGNSDNGYSQLAQLYYGSSDADRQDLLQAANTNLGLSGPWPIGTKVNIPAYKPIRTVTVNGRINKSTFAGQNGLSRAQLDALNNGPKWDALGPNIVAGTKVRVM
jgi:hypothetical protein